MTSSMEKIIVPARPGLDPVSIYFEDIEIGKGRVILICWDMAYTAYWGAIGNQTIKEFFVSISPDYIAGNMQGRHYKRSAADLAYLDKIIKAAHEHLKQVS